MGPGKRLTGLALRQGDSPASLEHLRLRRTIEHLAARFPINVRDLVIPQLERMSFPNFLDLLTGFLRSLLCHGDPDIFQGVRELAKQTADCGKSGGEQLMDTL